MNVALSHGKDRVSQTSGESETTSSFHLEGNPLMLSERTQQVYWRPILTSESTRFGRAAITRQLYPAAKRLLDVMISLVLLILLAPVLMLIAIAIKLDSPGPAIYIQRRGGLNGRLFDFYKFRSMTNGHDHIQEHRKFAEAYINGQATSVQHDGNGKTVFKPAGNHHHVTRIGRWLRQTSLDELPQLINVLQGDMSLVGPRPSIDHEVAMYTERHRQRLAVLPGITGWAQINGRSNLVFEDIVTLDLEYIGERSLRKDIHILLATLPVILQANGAG